MSDPTREDPKDSPVDWPDLMARLRVLETKVEWERESRIAADTEERTLRTQAASFREEALAKAEQFITEKSQEHNNLLQQMKEERTSFVTKEDMEKERAGQRDRMRLYVAVAGVVILILNFVIRYFTPLTQP